MKKLIAGLFEGSHLLLTSFLFAAALWLSPLTNPVRTWKYSGIAADRGGRIASELKLVLLDRGPWIAAGALIALSIAGFLRGDGKKIVGLARLVATAVALLMTLWASLDMAEQHLHRAWTPLFVATGVNLLFTGFLIGGGGGGGGKSSGGDKKDAKGK